MSCIVMSDVVYNDVVFLESNLKRSSCQVERERSFVGEFHYQNLNVLQQIERLL